MLTDGAQCVPSAYARAGVRVSVPALFPEMYARTRLSQRQGLLCSGVSNFWSNSKIDALYKAFQSAS